ncbi:MAG: hypothetical protein J0H49_00455 [Acidobacteria bacterium]|nr:hypothetical protein [Acidobacteriota bacterium]
MPILTWSLKQHNVSPVEAQWADFGRIPRQLSAEDRIRVVLDLYPCDVLFIHRDAEAQPPQLRRTEIAQSMAGSAVRHIPVVPVRMTEAWLLASETAIRSAAGNPNGNIALTLPNTRNLENLADPKRVLHTALATASGLNVRRRAKLAVHERVHLIPNYINDYSCLNALPAFRALQNDIRDLIEDNRNS